MRLETIREMYAKRAEHYDLEVGLFKYLLFFNTEKYRRIAIDKLKLEGGYTVLDIGCGTGLNFPLLEERVLK